MLCALIEYLEAGSWLDGAVVYKNRVFAALDGTNYASTSVGCQETYMMIPPGWMLAPDDSQSLEVIENYPWGAYAMVVASGYVEKML